MFAQRNSDGVPRGQRDARTRIDARRTISARLDVCPSARHLKVVAFAALLAAFASTPAFAQQPHTVKKGDTLWDLAKEYLQNPYLWPCIYESNRAEVKNPNLIYPAEKLTIPASCPQQGAPAQQPEETAGPGERTGFYVAPQRFNVSSDEDRPLARVSEREFYSAPWIADPATLPTNGRVVGVIEPAKAHEQDKLPELAHPEDRIYIAHVGANHAEVGDRLLVVHAERRVKDWGSIIIPAGIVQVDSVATDVLVASIVQQFGPLMPDYTTQPLEAYPEQTAGALEPVEGGSIGAVLDFVEQQPLYDLSDRGFVNLGRAQGVEVGDELLAYLPQTRLDKDKRVVVPDEAVGRLRVLRVEENTSTFRILALQHPAMRPGLSVRISRKAP